MLTARQLSFLSRPRGEPAPALPADHVVNLRQGRKRKHGQKDIAYSCDQELISFDCAPVCIISSGDGQATLAFKRGQSHVYTVGLFPEPDTNLECKKHPVANSYVV
ncbi:unnamed protein product [Symbiodinium necroappetens]|uniref:Uncharacterized protein n=1 Tax=Symbiodinium necroappetens TaxID=1628268 RepID=A0A812NQQ9_9DINO|nr:unnamed protein product [Symbiodinium necroappetens]